MRPYAGLTCSISGKIGTRKSDLALNAAFMNGPRVVVACEPMMVSAWVHVRSRHFPEAMFYADHGGIFGGVPSGDRQVVAVLAFTRLREADELLRWCDSIVVDLGTKDSGVTPAQALGGVLLHDKFEVYLETR